jgi:hypothetical protein
MTAPNHVARRIGAEYAKSTGLQSHADFRGWKAGRAAWERCVADLVSAWVGYRVSYVEATRIVGDLSRDDYEGYGCWQMGADLGFNREAWRQ